MELAQPVRIASSKADAPSRDMSISLGYGELGTLPGDFATMTVFP